jgi:hypothetical protein
MAKNATILTLTETTRRPDFEVGDLVTAEIHDGRKVCARATRRAYGNTWIRIVGLDPLPGYPVGTALVLDDSQIVDWS